jgi:hypothetical protein
MKLTKGRFIKLLNMNIQTRKKGKYNNNNHSKNIYSINRRNKKFYNFKNKTIKIKE